MKKNMSNIYFIVLDALRADHVKYMPWLSSKVNDGTYVENLEISSGFCERSEIFFSLPPSKTKFVNAITLDIDDTTKTKSYAWLKNWMVRLLEPFDKNKFFQKIIRRLLWNISIKKSFYSMYPQRIPLKILNKITLTEDIVDFEEYSKSIKSGFLYHYISRDYLINWEYFTSLSNPSFGNDFSRLETLKNKFSNYKKTFLPIYISLADVLGHEFGPHSPELIEALKKLDKHLSSFFKSCLKYDKNSSIHFLGDHGMEKVHTGINVDNIIKSIAEDLNLKPNQDFYYFLDSTMLRIWWQIDNQKKFDEFFDKLTFNEELKDKGYFIDDINFDNEGLPPIKDIADIVWWAKKGVQVAPDFFHNDINTKKGMHGYLKKDKVSKGFLLMITGKNSVKKSYKNLDILNLTDIL